MQLPLSTPIIVLLLLLGVSSGPIGVFGGCVISTLNLTASSNSTETSIQTVGPYFKDDKVNSVNITGGQAGVPLTMDFTVYNITSDSCQKMPNVYLDIWHANAYGHYSDFSAEGTLGETWCRGYQATDSNGHVQFVTIYPGWYTSRAVHIHTKLRIYDSTLTTTQYEQNTQLFFDDSFTTSVYAAAAPYNTRSARDTLNSGDNIYQAAYNVPMIVTGDVTNGFKTSIPIFYPLGVAGDTTNSYNAPYSSSSSTGSTTTTTATSSTGTSAVSSASSSSGTTSSSSASQISSTSWFTLVFVLITTIAIHLH